LSLGESCREPKAAPLIKWPGGKREILGSIIPLVPHSPQTYYEPFLGGAALFFALQPSRSVLSDANGELINLYQQVKESPRALIKILKTFRNSESFYYDVRSRSFRSPLKRAARLLYLTTLSFNGIHRVNLRGEFNVPYGHKTHLQTCDEERLMIASQALAQAKLRVADFESATANAKAGDTVYFDPPYTLAHANNGFLKYNEKIFSWSDQIRLADHARELAERGCNVIVSNADHASIRKLYPNFKNKTIQRFSRIAASGEFRKPITEILYYRCWEDN